MSVEAAVAPIPMQIGVSKASDQKPMLPLSLTVSNPPGLSLPVKMEITDTSSSGEGGQNVQSNHVPGGEALLAAAESHLAATARQQQHLPPGGPPGSAGVGLTTFPGLATTTMTTTCSNNPTSTSPLTGGGVATTSALSLNNPGTPNSSTNTTNTTSHNLPPASSNNEMFQAFQNWALQNYGDSGKTKTVTTKKYDRIVRILSGQEHATTENSKFRFWVKAKGFRLGPPPPDDPGAEDQVLYVPTRVPGAVNGDDDKSYKRVAVVEDFFQIIYNVHVEMDGRGGKHAGQKRTYRAIAETYSFLPREAVTRFLMSCADCQKRMHLSLETNNNHAPPPQDGSGVASTTNLSSSSSSQAPTASTVGALHLQHLQSVGTREVAGHPAIIDFSLPITTTYLNHLRSQRPLSPSSPPLGSGHLGGHHFYSSDQEGMYRASTPPEREDSMSSADSEMSGEHSPSPPAAAAANGSPRPADVKAEAGANNSNSRTSTPNSLRNNMPVKIKSEVDVSERNGTSAGIDEKPVKMAAVAKIEDRGRKRRASDESVDSSTRASESGLGDNDTKDDDEDDDGEDEEKLASADIDPERLKAFNMFVRLFVDENLDRMVPISKQPKDKIQAILDACDRQFPEFHERSRKRIRTYLKSCRRMRRSKEQNGWESLRPTPPHLTSAAAEGLLAQACENESNNAKRMRMGLEPLPASVTNIPPLPPSQNQHQQPSPGQAHHHQAHHPQQASPGQQAAASMVAAAAPNNTTTSSSTPSSSSRSATSTPTAPAASAPTQNALERPQPQQSTTPTAVVVGGTGSDYSRHSSPVSATFRPSPHELPSPFFSTTNGIFRPGLPASYGSPPAHHHHPGVLQGGAGGGAHGAGAVQNGESCPTDLSMKNKPQTTGSSTSSSSKNQLNPSEVATIKQLIAGYRESAAFLYRSADELEQLLLQQN